MLIEFDRSIGEALAAGGHDPMYEALETLATGRYEGKHVLFGDRDTLEQLARSPSLSPRSRAVYERVLNRLPQKWSLRHSAVRRLVVSATPGVTAGIRTVGDCRELVVPIQAMVDSATVQRTILLSENLQDVTLYVTMARVAARELGLGNVTLRYEPRGGGGSTVSNEYVAIQSGRDRLCLCIVDSDRESAVSGPGDTATPLIAADRPELVLTEVLVLIAREVENCIPTVVLGELSYASERMRAVADLERLEESTAAQVRAYVDLKRGTSLSEILTLHSDSPEGIWWAHHVEEIAKVLNWTRMCAGTGECERPDACECWISRAFGDRVLTAAINHFQTLTLQKVAESMCAHTRDEWLRVGQVVLSWCCAGEKMRAA